MDENNNLSRVEKHRKRRNIKRSIIILFIIGFLFTVVLISLILTNGSKSQEALGEDIQPNDDDAEIQDDQLIINEDNDISEENEIEEEIDTSNDIFIEYVEPSDDNVIEAYIADWDPVGTTQEGEHTTNYNAGSQDRIEIKRATSAVTNINGDDMVEWRVENGGDQKVVATVSDKDETDIFRVYLSWIDIEGWQVTKLEKLKENDKKQ